MSTRICFTHSMHGRGCTIRGQHLFGCDNDNCTGCLPRPAEVGMLCRNCFDKFCDSLTAANDLIPHLRSIERGGQSIDGVRSGTVVQPTYPASWQEADNLWMYLAGVTEANAQDTDAALPQWPYWTAPNRGFSFSADLAHVTQAVNEATQDLAARPVDIVARAGGAEAAINLYRAMQTALARFPLAEESRPVKYIRCRTCQKNTLRWMPPLEHLDDIVLQCANPTCGQIEDPIYATWNMRLLAQEFATQGVDTDLDAQITELLRVPAPDEATPICPTCAERTPPNLIVEKRKRIDEICNRCGNPTDHGLYRKATAA